MENKTIKIVIVGFFILLGVTLFSYGAFVHSTDVTVQAQDDLLMVTKSEPALVKDASVGGVIRDISGKIRQTYDQGEKPPETCST
jgi:hypothetical protein